MVTELDRKLALEFAEQKGMAKGMAKGIEKGIEKGIATGRAEGRNEAISELALKLKGIAVPAEKIAEVTGLSLNEIAAL